MTVMGDATLLGETTTRDLAVWCAMPSSPPRNVTEAR
jgi:hypothetical protein